MARSSGDTRLALLLLCAVAAAAVIASLLHLATSPCAYSSQLSRAMLSVAGLDPRLVSCGDSTAKKKPLLSSDNDDVRSSNTSGTGGPIATDFRLCFKPELPPNALPPYRCCPPVPSSDPINFTFPDPSEPLRVRRPVHSVGPAHLAKYARAVALMKALPRSDPRSFYQQANVHCAYCTGAHRQAGRPDLPVQIHFSWFFFPFHRAYLYFFERIAAKLLGEPGFAVPFWSWDVPEGMTFPKEFAVETSPLYDPVRNPRHRPPRVVDIDFSDVDRNLTDEQQIELNLRVMYKQMVTNAALPSLFHGQPYRAGQSDKPGAGTVELCPHNTVHTWTGDISLPNVEDMGTYYSAGRDPIFYPHHENIDRLWQAWRDIGGGKHLDFTDPDWLDASFLFYDEEARPVRVTVRDMLDTEKLRYTYAGVGHPWLDARPPVTPGVNKAKKLKSSPPSFPVALDKAAVSAQVMRPGEPKPRREEDVVEVLVVEGIKSDGGGMVKFDVYVNAVEYEKVAPGGREMAGSYVSLRRPGMEGTVVDSSMRLVLNGLLGDLGAETDDSVTVTLVPVMGKVSVGGLRIVYMKD